MLGFGTTEIAIIAVVMLMIFGPSRFPKMARSIAETMHIIKKLPEEIDDITKDM